MFDPQTSALIAAAPKLAGVDAATLPQQLTEAFAEIVSTRLRMRLGSTESISEGLSQSLLKLRRLAACHEAMVALQPDRQNRASAAFVAAAAHQAVAFGNSLSGSVITSYVNEASISANVCTSLLFLVADAHADAAEAAKGIEADNDANDVERAILAAVRFLARGELQAILRMPDPQVTADSSHEEQAVQGLINELLQGIKLLAAQLLRRVDPPDLVGGGESANSCFLRVKKLSVERIKDYHAGGDIYSLFPGPLHMANLLLAVERDLVSSGLCRLPAPDGIIENRWWRIIRKMARNRPYLWRNHRDAVAKGYLQRGTSSIVSFPTGGGKSTLAELKIASALLAGYQVVFLAPTNALVDQTARSLQRTFKDFDVQRDLGEEVGLEDIDILPEVIVTTPERCLFLMSVRKDVFGNLGLVVFDECHLLHPRDEDRSRRAVDAMLTLLNLISIAPDVDLLLLSAMMKNGEELAKWIESVVGRTCLTLDVAWKPTRQVRGTVVYPAQRIKELNAILSEARKAFSNKKNGAPASIERQLTAPPYGLFCLLQAWTSNDREDYALIPLVDEVPHFTTTRTSTGSWRITPNGNKVGAALATAAALGGLKTLVFVGSEVLAYSGVNECQLELADRHVLLSEEELKLFKLASEEMGGADHCYLKVSEGGIVRGGATCHHALLLREERRLHEMLFRRSDGLDVLFATSTLAQGMNLPSEVVIIAGDSRFDAAANRMATLEAHELLNAAGRAGRAGENSQGFVLIVPSRTVDFDEKSGRMNRHWETLQKIFGQSDQCLEISDPFVNLLDRIHDGSTQSSIAGYLLSKLPVTVAGVADDPMRQMLHRSLGVYKARQSGDEGWIRSRIDAAILAKSRIGDVAEASWLASVSALTGISEVALRKLWETIEGNNLDGSANIAISLLLDWISATPEGIFEALRPENIEGLFGVAYKKIKSDRERAEFALPTVRNLLLGWLSGQSLAELEKLVTERDGVGLCKTSRQFVLRVVPDLAFLAGLPAQLAKADTSQADSDSPKIAINYVLTNLSAIVREGCDSPECLAVRMNLGRENSRVASWCAYRSYLPFATPCDLFEDFGTTRHRMSMAAALFAFSEE